MIRILTISSLIMITLTIASNCKDGYIDPSLFLAFGADSNELSDQTTPPGFLAEDLNPEKPSEGDGQITVIIGGSQTPGWGFIRC